MHAGTKQILLINLDQSGGPDIILEKSNGEFEWFKNDQYSYTYDSENYWTYGSIHPGLRFLSSDILTSIDQNLANALLENLRYGNVWESNLQYDDYFNPILNKQNLDRLNWFVTYDEGITDLSGIEDARNLKYLRLEDSSVNDLSPIWGLKLLQTLDISWGGSLKSISGIQALKNLEYLDLSGQQISDISELLNLENLKLLELEENFIDLSDSTNQSLIAELRRRGVIVEVETQVPISVQQLSEQLRINKDQIDANDDPKANFVYGFEMLLELLESTETSSLKNVAINGGAAQSLIDFTLPDLWKSDLGYEDESELNAAADLNQLEDYVSTVFIPRLTTIRRHFAKMAFHNSTISIGQELTGSEDIIEVDSGDAYALMAFVEALKGFLQVLSSYQWDYNLQELEELEDNDLINLEALLDGSNQFGTLKTQNQLQNAKSSFENAVSYYISASNQMRERLDQALLFEMSSDDLEDDDQLRDDLQEFLLALENPHNLNEDESTEEIISLSAIFESKFDPVSMIPPVVGDKFESFEFPDPTFGGIMPNWTSDILKNKLLDEELISDDPLEGATEVEGLPNWNRSNWLGFFYIPPHDNPNQFWMFHQRLGWVYFDSRGPSDIWLFLSDLNDWLWTKKSAYPYLYSNAYQNWSYLQSDGSLIFWNKADSSWENSTN